MQEAVISLDYTQAEPYLQELLEKEGKDIWSHFLIANQYGTEQAHSEGKDGHGYSIRTEEAFQKPWKEQKTVVCEPSVSISTGRSVLGIGTPIVRNGKEVGVLIGYLRLESISDILNSYELSQDGYAFMINSDGTVSAHPDQNLVLHASFGESRTGRPRICCGCIRDTYLGRKQQCRSKENRDDQHCGEQCGHKAESGCRAFDELYRFQCDEGL